MPAPAAGLPSAMAVQTPASFEWMFGHRKSQLRPGLLWYVLLSLLVEMSMQRLQEGEH
jgi:hypothetical protein